MEPEGVAKHIKQNYSGLVAGYNTQPGNETGLFYNAPEPTQGNKNLQRHKKPTNNQMNQNQTNAALVASDQTM